MPGSSSTTTTTTQPSGQPTPSPVLTGPKARVKDDVTFGLNVRTSENTSSKANIVEAVLPGTLLTIIEPGGWTKIGAINQWVRVRTPKGNEGLAAAWYLEKIPGETYPTTTSTTSDHAEGSTSHATETTPASPAGKSKLVVQVKKNGLPVYETTSTKGKVVSTEKTGAKLVVVEEAGKAASKIGAAGKWLNVKASNGRRGFVDAGSVKVV
jgi:hypothetical protein